MRNKFVIPAAAVLFAVLLVTQGCKPPSPEVITKAVNVAGMQGTLFGLKKWSETQPEPAKECATALKKNIDTVLLPYLNGGTLPSSAEISAFIQSSLFTNVPSNIKDSIVLASVALDAALPIPDGNTYLKPEQVGYIKSFLSGVSDGCGAFLGRGVTDLRTNWIK